ncbi:MAG TPA: hypothetical protein VMD53_03370 [Rhizomicrobium sp.]|nr:hypothetical protein [Rhizomicrobium sp.]
MSTPTSIRNASQPAALWADPYVVIGAGAAALLFALCVFDVRLLNDGDTYWHLAAGDWMLRHAEVPHADPFSFSRSGAPWQAHEWLAEIMMALSFAWGGWNGVVTFYGFSLAATALLLVSALRRFLSPTSLTVTLVLAFSCIAPNLLARPHILVLPVIVAWTAALLRARDEGRAPSLWAAILMLLWANLHGSFVFGFLLLACFGLEALVESPADHRIRTLRQWALFAAASVAMAAITPQGPAGLVFPFKLMAMTSLRGVDEWRAMDFSSFNLFEVALAATLFVCFTRGVTIPPLRALLLVFLLHMALQHNRHAIVTALVAALILAEPLARALGQTRSTAAPPMANAWLGFAAIALVMITVRTSDPIVRTDGATTPATALDHVPGALRTQNVLNEYDFGGYLIFRGVKPYIDGRTDLYGDAFMDRYFQITRPDRGALEQTLRNAHVAWTIFSPASPVVDLMDSEAGWKRLYADRFAVIHVRVPSAP